MAGVELRMDKEVAVSDITVGIIEPLSHCSIFHLSLPGTGFAYTAAAGVAAEEEEGEEEEEGDGEGLEGLAEGGGVAKLRQNCLCMNCLQYLAIRISIYLIISFYRKSNERKERKKEKERKKRKKKGKKGRFFH